jgi:integrase
MGVKVRFRRGKWWVFVYRNKKQYAKCLKDGDEDLAKEVARELIAKLARGDQGFLEQWKAPAAVPAPAVPLYPFDAYFQQWLEGYARTHCKASTLAGYRHAFELYLRPSFGNRDLAAITRADVKQLAFDLLDGKLPGNPINPRTKKPAKRRAGKKSRAYVKATLAPLCEMFNHAIEDGHFTGTNPALRVLKRTRGEELPRHRRADFLTSEEAAGLLAAARAHFPRWHPFVLCLLHTGLRIGEAIAIQWGDIDQAGRFLAIERNLVDGKVTTPKSGKGRRVDLSGELAGALEQVRTRRKARALEEGRPAPTTGDWVFVNDEGNAVDPDNFRKRVWPKLLEKAGLRAIRIHDLRHTFASLLIGQGEGLPYVRDQMGHHSIALTVDTYGHLVPGGNRAAVDRLASRLRSAGNRPPSGPPLDRLDRGGRRPSSGSPNLAVSQVEPMGVEPTTSRVRF